MLPTIGAGRSANGPSIVFLTGASGSGKTAIVQELRARDPRGSYLHFDSIGVPDAATMIREFGSGERWQAEMTRLRIGRIATEYGARERVVLEGQARPSFVESALEEHRIARSAIVLVHCRDDEREARLRRRGQPELVNPQMRAWSAFLLRDAGARELQVIDTTLLTIADAASVVLQAAGVLSAV